MSQYKSFVYSTWKKVLVVKVYLYFCPKWLLEEKSLEMTNLMMEEGYRELQTPRQPKDSWRPFSSDLRKFKIRINNLFSANNNNKKIQTWGLFKDFWMKEIYSFIPVLTVLVSWAMYHSKVAAFTGDVALNKQVGFTVWHLHSSRGYNVMKNL